MSRRRTRAFAHPFGKVPDLDPPLSEGLRNDRHVRALCRCGVVVALDVRPWTFEASSPLRRFEERVRCKRCGARSVPLEIWFGPVRAKPQDAIYVFR